MLCWIEFYYETRSFISKFKDLLYEKKKDRKNLNIQNHKMKCNISSWFKHKLYNNGNTTGRIINNSIKIQKEKNRTHYFYCLFSKSMNFLKLYLCVINLNILSVFVKVLLHLLILIFQLQFEFLSQLSWKRKVCNFRFIHKI